MRMHIDRTFIVAIAALLGAAACTEPSGGGGGGGSGNSHVVMLDLPVTGGAGTSCFDVPLADVDATTPGEQYECSVSDLAFAGAPNQQETVLPACNNASVPPSSTNKPCWGIVIDAMTCPMAPSLRLVVERNEAPDPSTHIIASCVAES